MKTKLLCLVAVILFGYGSNAQVAGPVTITGTGTGGWVQPGNVALSSTDGGVTWTKSNFEIVGDGNMKFSEAGTWESTAGFNANTTAPGFPSGVAMVNGGSNIVGTLGFWNVTYNAVSKAYSFTPGVNPNPVVQINGGGLTTPVTMNTSNGVAYNKKSVMFPGGPMSFNQTVPTTAQWGGGFPDGPVANNTTVSVPMGIYNVYFVLPGAGPAEYVFEPTVVSMIGNFVGSGWGTDLDLETVDNVIFTKTNHTFTPNAPDALVKFKIRDNHDWTNQFGVPVANEESYTGVAVTTGAQDMTIAPGTYTVSFNRNTYEYSFTNLLSNNPFSKAISKVYPNPTNNNWNFSNSENAIDSIQIIDLLGKIVVNQVANTNEVRVDASGLTAGIYFAKIKSGNAMETVKLIKN